MQTVDNASVVAVCLSDWSLEVKFHTCDAARFVCDFVVFGLYETLHALTGTGRREHITPVWRQLQRLPVRPRIGFKLTVLNVPSPQYRTPPADDFGRFNLYVPSTCEVPRTRTSLGGRSFNVAGPSLWNNLYLLHGSPSSPSPLASSLTRSVFHSKLKTWLFGKSFLP